MSTDQPTNPHRGSDFTEFMIEEGLMPTPRTDAIARAGHNESVYIARMTHLARQLERELAAERALADRLADALSQIQAKCCDMSIALHPDADAKGCVDDCWEWSEQALADWEEARRGAD